MSLPRISASKITTFVECQSMYVARYHLKMKPKVETTWAILGTAVHESIQRAYAGEFPYSVVDEVINRRFDAIGDTPWIGYTHNQIRDKAFAILDAFDYDQYIPKFMEKEFLLPYPYNNPVCELHGFIDLITEDGRIVDFKTNAKAPTKKQVNEHVQLSLYTYAYQQITGMPAKEVAIHHLPTNRYIVADYDSLLEQLPKIEEYIKQMLVLDENTPIVPCKDCGPFCPLKDWGE